MSRKWILLVDSLILDAGSVEMQQSAADPRFWRGVKRGGVIIESFQPVKSFFWVRLMEANFFVTSERIRW